MANTTAGDAISEAEDCPRDDMELADEQGAEYSDGGEEEEEGEKG